VKWLLLIGLFLFSSLEANTSKNDNPINEETNDLQKVLYLNYEKLPSRVLKGEIFKITIKSLSTTSNFTDIIYDLSGSYGLKLLNDFPSREIGDPYYYETFYFLVTSKKARLPDFTATLIDYNDKEYKKTTIKGNKLNVVELNPKREFANILANSFSLIDYKTTSYDNRHNIIVFVATAINCDIASFKLNNVYKQGIESINESYAESKITYYAIVDKKMENLSFSYFNVGSNKFSLINIPIILDDDSVTTQSDLKPKDLSRERLKMSIAATIALLSFIMVLWRKKYIYLIFIIIPLSYVVYIGIPSKDICIKEGSNIHLLPMSNGTIFETTEISYHLKKEGQVKDWTKIQLKNKKVGWVKNEDICSY